MKTQLQTDIAAFALEATDLLSLLAAFKQKCADLEMRGESIVARIAVEAPEYASAANAAMEPLRYSVATMLGKVQ